MMKRKWERGAMPPRTLLKGPADASPIFICFFCIRFEVFVSTWMCTFVRTYVLAWPDKSNDRGTIIKRCDFFSIRVQYFFGFVIQFVLN
jgi:hypothetical protein